MCNIFLLKRRMNGLLVSDNSICIEGSSKSSACLYTKRVRGISHCHWLLKCLFVAVIIDSKWTDEHFHVITMLMHCNVDSKMTRKQTKSIRTTLAEALAELVIADFSARVQWVFQFCECGLVHELKLVSLVSSGTLTKLEIGDLNFSATWNQLV